MIKKKNGNLFWIGSFLGMLMGFSFSFMLQFSFKKWRRIRESKRPFLLFLSFFPLKAMEDLDMGFFFPLRISSLPIYFPYFFPMILFLLLSLTFDSDSPLFFLVEFEQMHSIQIQNRRTIGWSPHWRFRSPCDQFPKGQRNAIPKGTFQPL